MTLIPVTLERTPGLPPDEAPGIFLGWDSADYPFLFWWSERGERWVGAARDANGHGARWLVRPPVIVSHALVWREGE